MCVLYASVCCGAHYVLCAHVCCGTHVYCVHMLWCICVLCTCCGVRMLTRVCCGRCVRIVVHMCVQCKCALVTRPTLLHPERAKLRVADFAQEQESIERCTYIEKSEHPAGS